MPRTVDAQQLSLEALAEHPQSSKETRAASGGSAPRNQGSDVPTGREEGQQEPTHTATRLSPAELLRTPGALLTRSHLRSLGLERRAIDAVFRALPVVELPGYSRPMIRAEEFLELVEHSTYRDDRVRACHA
jgi:hypothetical protein